MDENLVGYLLKALDSATHREVEEYLRGNPEAQKRLELLRHALVPLAEDKGLIAMPPPGLRHATLARVAESRCRDLPSAPPPPPSRSTIPLRSWWRWPDALVAAAILLLALPLVALLVSHLHGDYRIYSCKNNLRLFHGALIAYADLHQGQLPKLKDAPPENMAGIFVPILKENQLLSQEVSIACPANGHRSPTEYSVPQLDDLYHQHRGEFLRQARALGGCYAYVLGYRNSAGDLHGLRRGVDGDEMPLMADRPPFDEDNPTGLLDRLSTNHGSRGQNVLFLGGHVTFTTSRKVGPEGDDIFTNEAGQLDAGLHSRDSVLGASAVRVKRLSGTRFRE